MISGIRVGVPSNHRSLLVLSCDDCAPPCIFGAKRPNRIDAGARRLFARGKLRPQKTPFPSTFDFPVTAAKRFQRRHSQP